MARKVLRAGGMRVVDDDDDVFLTTVRALFLRCGTEGSPSGSLGDGIRTAYDQMDGKDGSGGVDFLGPGSWLPPGLLRSFSAEYEEGCRCADRVGWRVDQRVFDRILVRGKFSWALSYFHIEV